MITLDCQKAKISLSGANCIITAPYNAELVAEIKNIPGRKWNPDKKCWMVPARAEDEAREIVRKFFAIQGEESRIEYELLDMTVIGDNTHKKSYPHNVEIDGCEIMNLNYGNIISVSPTFQVISEEGGFTSGDAKHAFTVQFRIQVKCRKGAKIEGTGRCGKGQFEIHSRQDWTEAMGLTSFEERKMQSQKIEEKMEAALSLFSSDFLQRVGTAKWPNAAKRICDLLPAIGNYQEMEAIVSRNDKFFVILARYQDLYSVSVHECKTGELFCREFARSLVVLDEILAKKHRFPGFDLTYYSLQPRWTSIASIRESLQNEDSARESESQAEEDGSSTSLKNKVLTFGKYQGQSLASVPTSYLKWLMQHARVMKEENRKFALFAKEILTSDAN